MGVDDCGHGDHVHGDHVHGDCVHGDHVHGDCVHDHGHGDSDHHLKLNEIKFLLINRIYDVTSAMMEDKNSNEINSKSSY